MAIPPVGHIPASARSPEKGKVQAVLDRHCEDYPKAIPAGCNLVVMPGNMPEKDSTILYHGGNIKPDGPQNWGSTSKQFTAACIDKLVQRREIRYDQDIRELCPDLPKFKLNGVIQTVTVDDLLHMRSGLPEVWAISLLNGVDAETLDNDQLLNLLDIHPGMVFAPGSKEMYCNTNYYVLAKIVKDVSGVPFVDYVRDKVLAPLKMQTRCSIDPSCPETIPGYDGDPSSKTYMQEVTSPNRTFGTTGLIGPPSDMVPWNAAIARREYDLLEPPKGFTGIPKGVYCRGLVIEQVGDYLRISHNGALAGAVTIYRRYEHPDPRKTFAFFLTTNVDNIPKIEKTADDVANALVGKEIEKTHASRYQIDKSLKSDAQVFSGTYRCEELGTEWIVSPKEKEPGKWAVHMMLSDKRKFPRLDFDPKRTKDGHLVFQSSYGGGTLERTPNGFTYHAGNMAPLHFTRGPFIKYL
jgi:CubicO group peptidase (beta-lactamase class C family)